ncbi:MAG: hypothetical protein QT10_C0003G0009 [archaeon GW2011_AR19]|nr:MAG: hypothetical protein QT10_C0003G0009 [archaeon GW2011_AR19]
MNKFPDKDRARSLMQNSIRDMKYTLTLNISEESANTIVRNIYESFRMLGEAILLKKGIRPIDHINSIDEILKLELKTSKPLNILENLRRLRHNINYYGYKANIYDAKESISFAKNCFNELLKKINKIIEN